MAQLNSVPSRLQEDGACDGVGADPLVLHLLSFGVRFGFRVQGGLEIRCTVGCRELDGGKHDGALRFRGTQSSTTVLTRSWTFCPKP